MRQKIVFNAPDEADALSKKELSKLIEKLLTNHYGESNDKDECKEEPTS